MADPLRARLATLAEDFTGRYDEKRCLDLVQALWRSDMPSDYRAFHRTATFAADELRRVGLAEVEIVSCPADGRTRVQAWTMPLAWEGGEARLRIVSPHEELVCDRAENPFTCSMWSEPTPPGGATGPLFVVDSPAAVPESRRALFAGAFLLTGRNPRGEMKVFANTVGAAALISHFVPHGERHPDATGWCNGWSDDAGAWALTAADSRMTGFMIPAAAGARLRRLVADGPVTCHATVGGRVGEGILPVVTGVVPGETDEEILLVGHLYETGANDNASGCGVMMEAVRLMAAMGKPRRRVRILLSGECYGSYSFFTQRPDLLRRIAAGLNVDCVGEPETEGRPHAWHRTPEAHPSAVDTLFRKTMGITERTPGGLRAEEGAHGLSDNAVCDPAAGVPTPIFMRAPWTWHTDRDDWSQIAPASIKRAAVATAVYARWLAEAGPDEADALGRVVAAEAIAGNLPVPPGLEEHEPLPEKRRAFTVDRARARVLWTGRLGAAKAEQLAAAIPALDFSILVEPGDGGEEERRTVVSRRFWGAPTFDGIPRSDRDGFPDPRWSSPYIAACYWADGVRTVAQVSALVRAELGVAPERLLPFFRVLERAGLVSLSSR